MAAVDDLVDLVVMASHGRTGFRRAMLGSVTGKVLREGTTPVLVVHAKEAPSATPRQEPELAMPLF